MASKLLNKNFFIRAASGLVLVAVLLAGTVYSDLTKYIIFAIIALFAHNEMITTLIPKDVKIVKWFSITLSIATLLSFSFYKFGYVSQLMLYIIPISIIFVRFIVEMFRKSVNPSYNISYDIFAIAYTVVPILLLTTLPSMLIVALLLVIWTNDVGAYITGVMFGRHRLCERLSPKKSWEGFFGGIVSAVIVAFFTSHIAEGFNTITWSVTAIFIAIAGVLGDLFESMLKRSVGAKDSGSTIPGHGGFLDRFDALFFAAPVVWIIYNLIINYFILEN